MALENIQGPIPELSLQAPGWLQLYSQAAAKYVQPVPSEYNTREGAKVLRESHAASAAGSSSAGLVGRGAAAASAGRQASKAAYLSSPYSKRLAAFGEDESGGVSAGAPTLPVVAFDAVYGGGASAATSGLASDDDYAEALKSLVDLGFHATGAPADPAAGCGGGGGRGGGGAGGGGPGGLKLVSKFPVKGEAGQKMPGARKQGAKYISSGHGCARKTKTSRTRNPTSPAQSLPLKPHQVAPPISA